MDSLPWAQYAGVTQKLVFKNNITSIGAYTFSNFYNVTEIEFGQSVKTIKNWCFPMPSDWEVTDIYFARGSRLKSISSAIYTSGCVIHGTLNTVAEAFAASFSEYYTYMESAEYFAFDENTKTLTFNYPGDIPDYSLSTCQNTSWAQYADKAEKLVIGSSVTSIGSYAFYGFSKLESVTVSKSITSIGESAFNGCINIEELIFESGSTLAVIGNMAFSNCSSLTVLHLPASLTSVNRYSFYNCSGISDVYYIGTNSDVISILNIIFGYGNVHSFVARVNDTQYYTFSEAAEAAGKTETIELICNTPESYELKNRNDILKVRTNGYSVNITAPSGFSVFSFTDSNGVTTYGVPYFYGQTLSTAGEIACNFYISLPAGSEELLTVKANTTVGSTEKEYIYTTENMTPYSSYFIASVGVAAKDMGNTITMHIVDENDVVYGEIEYSVKQYCYNTINKNKDNTSREKLVNFAASILNYGAYAQLQFNVNTDNLVNAGLADYTDTSGNALFTTDLSDAPVKDESWKATGGTGNTENITFVGQTVSATSNTQISYYLKLSDSIENYTFSVTKAGTATTKAISVRALSGSSQYNCVVTILDIPAKNLGDVYTLTVTKDSETAEKNYSVLTYIYNQYDKGSTLGNMVRAMYLYYAAAAEYFK